MDTFTPTQPISNDKSNEYIIESPNDTEEREAKEKQEAKYDETRRKSHALGDEDKGLAAAKEEKTEEEEYKAAKQQIVKSRKDGEDGEDGQDGQDGEDGQDGQDVEDAFHDTNSGQLASGEEPASPALSDAEKGKETKEASPANNPDNTYTITLEITDPKTGAFVGTVNMKPSVVEAIGGRTHHHHHRHRRRTHGNRKSKRRTQQTAKKQRTKRRATRSRRRSKRRTMRRTMRGG